MGGADVQAQESVQASQYKAVPFSQETGLEITKADTLLGSALNVRG